MVFLSSGVSLPGCAAAHNHYKGNSPKRQGEGAGKMRNILGEPAFEIKNRFPMSCILYFSR